METVEESLYQRVWGEPPPEPEESPSPSVEAYSAPLPSAAPPLLGPDPVEAPYPQTSVRAGNFALNGEGRIEAQNLPQDGISEQWREALVWLRRMLDANNKTLGVLFESQRQLRDTVNELSSRLDLALTTFGKVEEASRSRLSNFSLETDGKIAEQLQGAEARTTNLVRSFQAQMTESLQASQARLRSVENHMTESLQASQERLSSAEAHMAELVEASDVRLENRMKDLEKRILKTLEWLKEKDDAVAEKLQGLDRGIQKATKSSTKRTNELAIRHLELEENMAAHQAEVTKKLNSMSKKPGGRTSTGQPRAGRRGEYQS